MLRDDQLRWLNKLSTTNQVVIVPYKPELQLIFERVKAEIQAILGNEVHILLRGATALQISGKGELDIFIPVSPKHFPIVLEKLTLYYKDPDSMSELNRARFNIIHEKTEVELQLVNEESQVWKENSLFYEYLKSHPDTLRKYKNLKEDAHGLSTREYYTKKLEFINNVLDDASKNI